jgi:hypothetical protein
MKGRTRLSWKSINLCQLHHQSWIFASFKLTSCPSFLVLVSRICVLSRCTCDIAAPSDYCCTSHSIWKPHDPVETPLFMFQVNTFSGGRDSGPGIQEFTKKHRDAKPFMGVPCNRIAAKPTRSTRPPSTRPVSRSPSVPLQHVPLMPQPQSNTNYGTRSNHFRKLSSESAPLLCFAPMCMCASLFKPCDASRCSEARQCHTWRYMTNEYRSPEPR